MHAIPDTNIGAGSRRGPLSKATTTTTTTTITEPSKSSRRTLLDLPAEIRYSIYTALSPPGTRFTASQHLKEPTNNKHEGTDNSWLLPHASRSHSCQINGQDLDYFLNILGVCRLIRQEALEVLNRNLRGTFEIGPTAILFDRVLPLIINLVDEVVRQGQCMHWHESEYFLHFPNLKRAVVGRFVGCLRGYHVDPQGQEDLQHQQDVVAPPKLVLAYMSKLEKKRFISKVVAEIEATCPYDLGPLGRQTPESLDPYMTAFEACPRRWTLGTGKFPWQIIAQLWLIDDPAGGDAVQDGLLVNYDFNHFRVVSVEEKSFELCQREDHVSGPPDREWMEVRNWVMRDHFEGSVR